MATVFDIGPLTWVKSEIDSSLERARVNLSDFSRNPVDRKSIRAAQTHLHQASGAVQIVGLEGVSRLFDETERLVADIESGKIETQLVVFDTLERATRAIGTYLAELLDGAPDQPLRLYPFYEAVAAARGRKDATQAELYFPDLSLSPPPREESPTRLQGEELSIYVRGQRGRFQRGFLQWLKSSGDKAGIEDMASAVAGIESMQRIPAQRGFWWSAGAFFEALASGVLPASAGVKLLCSRIEQQVRRAGEQGHAVPLQLMRETLYWVARFASEFPGHCGPRTTQTIECYSLAGSLPALSDAVAPVPGSGEDAPRARALLIDIAAAKSSLDLAADRGGQAEISKLEQQLRTMDERASSLGNADLSSLVRELCLVTAYLVANPGRMGKEVATEMAIALLLCESAVERYAELPRDFDRQVRTIRARLGAAAFGKHDPEALQSLPLVEEITRRSQERHALDGAVTEIQANLRKLEQALDSYFRDPGAVSGLNAIEPMIHQINGALQLLGEHEALRSMQACGERIAAFRASSNRPSLQEFDELAQTLSGLGFYLDALRHGKADFAQAMRPISNSAPRSTAADPKQLPLPAEDRQSSSLEQEEPRIRPILVEPSADIRRLAEVSEETLDEELLAIFLEEAVEVLGGVETSLKAGRAQPGNGRDLAGIRRAFHTLKGSGRMVGLARLGEVAWSVEQVMNLWLQEERPFGEDLLLFLDEAHASFADWVACLQAGKSQPDATKILDMAERLRLSQAESGGIAAAAPQTIAPDVQDLPEDNLVRIGDARISASLFAVFANEARQLLDSLERELARAAADGYAGVRDEVLRATHTLAGICGTVKLAPMHELGLALEGALLRMKNRTSSPDSNERALLNDAVQALKLMYAGVLERAAPGPARRLIAQLSAVQGEAATLVPQPDDTASHALAAEIAADSLAVADRVDTIAIEEVPLERRQRRLEDEIDPQLLPLFLDEAGELVPRASELLRDWRATPNELGHAKALQRVLHTLKGSARMAGAMSLGELTHHMETRVENALALRLTPPQLFDDLDTSFDRMDLLLTHLRQTGLAPLPEVDLSQAGLAGSQTANETKSRQEAEAGIAPLSEASEAPMDEGGAQPTVPLLRETAQARAMLRVRADALDKLVNEAGEVAIVRSRIEGEMRTLKSALSELAENVSRLRRELREIEIAAESQLASRAQIVQETERKFDALEFDRYTRFQELTRMMAESVNDVATVQQTLIKVADDTDLALAAQARLNRELQQDLMRVRMVPIGSMADRLHRIVRQASKELGKRANLEIRGANVEVDRSVLERITGPFEHLLRNAISHGLELPEVRVSRGKAELGEISLDVRQEGNEVVLVLADDGAGLDLDRIRSRAKAQGLVAAGESRSDQELADLIFLPGFSTAEAVTELAGRGVGMDVVRNEVSELRGRIELLSSAGFGTRFTIRLPLTTAVTQAVLVRVGTRTYALPAAMVEQVQQLRVEPLARARGAGLIEWAGRRYVLHVLATLLGERSLPPPDRRFTPVLLVRSGAESIAVEVDDMLGNQEIVVKNIGPQLSRVPGVAGATVLGSGEIVLLLNPVPLATRTPLPVRREPLPDGRGEVPVDQSQAPGMAAPAQAAQPRIMVVDDSLTVRKITGRLLVREGYQVLTSKDGVEALEILNEIVPDVMLVDVEMPRMDGFDLTRNVRADARLKSVPIIMITSRTADKHRDYALELGVNVFLGKPYQEDELLSHIAGFVGRGNQPPVS